METAKAYHFATRAEGLETLQILAGKWKIEGKNYPAAPQNPEMAVHGEDVYSWLTGNFFLVNNWKHLFEKDGHQGISILGYDQSKQELFTRNFDNLGFERRYTITKVNKKWNFLGENERAIREFSADYAMYTEHWEMKDSTGNWVPLCIMKGTKYA